MAALRSLQDPQQAGARTRRCNFPIASSLLPALPSPSNRRLTTTSSVRPYHGYIVSTNRRFAVPNALQGKSDVTKIRDMTFPFGPKFNPSVSSRVSRPQVGHLLQQVTSTPVTTFSRSFRHIAVRTVLLYAVAGRNRRASGAGGPSAAWAPDRRFDVARAPKSPLVPGRPHPTVHPRFSRAKCRRGQDAHPPPSPTCRIAARPSPNVSHTLCVATLLTRHVVVASHF